MDILVSKLIYSKPSGSIEKLRKELNLKKIVPVLSKKKYTAKPKLPLSKTEKQNLLANYSIDDIPKTSLAMLSPSNNSSPYLCGKKSESGKFILDKYAVETTVDCLEIDLIVVDFMPLAFHQPPIH